MSLPQDSDSPPEHTDTKKETPNPTGETPLPTRETPEQTDSSELIKEASYQPEIGGPASDSPTEKIEPKDQNGNNCQCHSTVKENK